MQTFLPYKSFKQSAQVLDNKRLGKQRVETLQILNTLTGKSTGWVNHPAVKMWRGYEKALCAYGLAICEEWHYNRGFRDTCWDKIYDIERELDPDRNARDWDCRAYTQPPWITEELCISHRSNLLRKDPAYYRRYWPDIPDNLPYIWPTPPVMKIRNLWPVS